jgi:hypothetical protein
LPHPSIHPSIMSVTIILTHSLANDSRAQLEPWLGMSRPKREINVPNTTSRVLSALWSLAKSGNSGKVWQLLPGNITNPVRVAVGSPPAYRARPTWDMPAQHSNSASAAVVSIYTSETRHCGIQILASPAATSARPYWSALKAPSRPASVRF